MFCSSRRELSFPEYGSSKLLRSAAIPNYANTRHHIPDAVTLIVTTAFTVFANIPCSITVPYFFAVCFVTRITLSLNTTSQNRNIMTDHWMSWHLLKEIQFLQDECVNSSPAHKMSQRFTSLSIIYLTARVRYFVVTIERKFVYLHFARLEWVFHSSNLTFRGPCFVTYSYNKSQ
jgi:hypothetical protein